MAGRVCKAAGRESRPSMYDLGALRDSPVFWGWGAYPGSVSSLPFVYHIEGTIKKSQRRMAASCHAFECPGANIENFGLECGPSAEGSSTSQQRN
jgi:hypothetical protein